MGRKRREITAEKVATLLCVAYSHFHLFVRVKKHVAGQEGAMNEATARLHAQTAQFCHIGIQELVPKLKTCLHKGSDYMSIKIQPDATVCRYLFPANSLNMFRVSQHPSSGVLNTVTAASGTGHTVKYKD